MSGHRAAAVRAKGGWAPWSAVCTGGWRAGLTEGKQHAQRLADDHNRLHDAHDIATTSLRCECLDPDELEWDPAGPCARCRLIDVLGEIA